MEEELEINKEDYLKAKEIVETYEKQFWDRYKKMIQELEIYLESNLVCGQKIKKFDVHINLFNTVYVHPLDPLFTKNNFVAPNRDEKAINDIENIGKKYNGWELRLSYD